MQDRRYRKHNEFFQSSSGYPIRSPLSVNKKIKAVVFPAQREVVVIATTAAAFTVVYLARKIAAWPLAYEYVHT